MDHFKRSIVEQIEILNNHRMSGKPLDFFFVREHALLIAHLSDQLLAVVGAPALSDTDTQI